MIELSEDKKKALEFFGKKHEAPAKTEDEIAAEKKAEEDRLAAEAKRKEDELAEQKKKEEAGKKVPAAKEELTDAELLAIASKKAGRTINSWDDLKLTPTEEDAKRDREKRENDKLTFGLKKGLFNRNQYESFVAESQDHRNVVYKRELEEAKKEDANLDENEFKAEFEERFGLNLDESAAKRKRGERQLSKLADSILKNEYSSIYALDEEYSQYENYQKKVSERENKVLQLAPIYKKDVEDVLAGMSGIEMEFEGEKYTVNIPEGTLTTLSEMLLENNFANSQITKGYKKEDLDIIAKNYAIAQNFSLLAYEAAKQYKRKHDKGVRGIVEGGPIQKEGNPYENLTENQKKALDFFKVPEKSAN